MLKTCQTLLHKIQVLQVKKKKRGGSRRDYLLISHGFESTPSTCQDWHLYSLRESLNVFFFPSAFLGTIATHSTNTWRGLWMHRYYVLKHLQTLRSLPCARTRFPADKLGQRERLETRECGNCWSIEWRQQHSGTREDLEFSGGCMGSWELNPGSDTSSGEIASDFKHHWLITATTIYTSWRPAPRSPALPPSALTARDRWLLQVRFFVLFCQA